MSLRDAGSYRRLALRIWRSPLLFLLVYVVLRRVIAMVLVGVRSSDFKELEIVVLRHELERSRPSRRDRAPGRSRCNQRDIDLGSVEMMTSS